MSELVGEAVASLETPRLLIDLDIVDANLRRMFDSFADSATAVRVHFKSLKCAGLAQYVAARGANGFLCAKLNEAEILAGAGMNDILIANQIIGAKKIQRLVALARRTAVRVCVDNRDNVEQMAGAAQAAGVTIGALVEVDIGMNRCGVDWGRPALELAQFVHSLPGVRFEGLQGYDGHLQLMPNDGKKRAECLSSLEKLISTKRLIENEGIAVAIVTGAGTGTWEYVGSYKGVTEIQPGSFVLMDSAYKNVRPEFGCALSILTQVISKRTGWYVLDAGSKAISQDFGAPLVKGCPTESAIRLAEEHTVVEGDVAKVKIGDRREVIPAHCCATMNLHRLCLGVRQGVVETVWPIEASGRYD